MDFHSLLNLLISLLASCLWPFSICYLVSFLSPSLRAPGRPVLSSPSTCCCRLCPPASTPAKLMNGYMVLTNGGSQPRSSPSLSSRTFSRPAGDILVNMDTEPLVRKIDTVVKLDAVSLSLRSRTVEHCLLISIAYCVFIYVYIVGVVTLLYVQSFLPGSLHVPLLPAPSIVCINPCVVSCNAPCRRCLMLL